MTSDQIKDKVFSVCDELHAAGEKISIRLILSMVDEVSSSSTIHKYHAQWRDQLEANQDALYEKLGFSSQFTQMFMHEITRFSAEAERRYKESAVAATEARNEAIAELTIVEDKFLKQVALVDSLHNKLDEAILEKGALLKEHAAEMKKLQSNSDTLASELRHQITELQDKLQESRLSNEQLRTDFAKSELKLEQNSVLVDEVKLREEELQQEREKLSQKVSELTASLATATSNSNAAHEANKVKVEQNNELKTQITQLNQEVKLLRQKENELIRVQSEHQASQKMSEQLTKSLEAADKQVKDATESKTEAIAEAADLRSELSSLRRELNELRVTANGQQKEIGSLTTLNEHLNKRIESYERSVSAES
ncbi:DNA-binding protein [Vibrio parahaemolyticus]|nr:DNA-binding protein [Vibrio parahaemolyticus]